MGRPVQSDGSARLLALAASQHGIFTRAQAAACGLDSRRLRTLERAGIVERWSDTVLCVCGATPSMRQETLAAVFAGGPGCLATGRTAAALNGFDGYDIDNTTVDLLVPETRRGFAWPGATVRFSSRIQDADCAVIDGIPCTDAIRTWFMLCVIESQDRAEEVLDTIERDGLVRRADLHARLSMWREMGRNGVTVAAAILDGREEVGHTPTNKLERKLVRAIARAGIVAPVCQYGVTRADGRRASLDAAWPVLRFGAEADGHGSHATRKQRRADNRRQRSLSAVDWEITRFTWEEVLHEPDEFGRELRVAIIARARQLGFDPAPFFAPERAYARSRPIRALEAPRRGT